MSESFGARARKFMGWYSPEEPIDEFDEFDEVEEVAPVADITPVSRPTLTSIRRDEPAEDLTRIVTIHPTAYSDAVTIGEAFRDGTPSSSTSRTWARKRRVDWLTSQPA